MKSTLNHCNATVTAIFWRELSGLILNKVRAVEKKIIERKKMLKTLLYLQNY